MVKFLSRVLIKPYVHPRKHLYSSVNLNSLIGVVEMPRRKENEVEHFFESAEEEARFASIEADVEALNRLIQERKSRE